MLEGLFKVIKNIIVTSIFSVVLLSILSCGEEGLIDPHGEVEFSPSVSAGFQASEFPTNNGSAWTYLNVGTKLYNPGQGEVILKLLEETFTIRIEGIRDINGFTNRQATISEIRAIVLAESTVFNQQGGEERVVQEEERIFRETVNHLSANGFYFRVDSNFLGVDFPLSATYFSRTPQAYTESAFDAYVFVPNNPVMHQKHFPPRLLWDFPLQLGKEWTVFETQTLPSHRVVRRVVDIYASVTVPAGSYDNAYLVEEEIVGLSELSEAQLYKPAKYWVVPNVGVVKYQYNYPDWTLMNRFGVYLALSRDFELRHFELPVDLSR